VATLYVVQPAASPHCLDALTHAIERYTARAATLLSDIATERAFAGGVLRERHLSGHADLTGVTHYMQSAAHSMSSSCSLPWVGMPVSGSQPIMA